MTGAEGAAWSTKDNRSCERSGKDTRAERAELEDGEQSMLGGGKLITADPRLQSEQESPSKEPGEARGGRRGTE